MRAPAWLTTMSLCALSACATRAPEEKIATPVFLQQVAREETASVLRVRTTDVVTDGQIARIRGTVENIGTERVEGIRYLVLFLSDGQPPRILDQYQHEVDTTLDPGARKGVSIDAESSYNGRTGFNPAAIIATPVTLGGKAVPPPAEWK